MAKANKDKFVEHTCTECTQTTNYAMGLDRGTAHIVLAVYNAVRRLDRNRIHVAKEMIAADSDFPKYREMIEAGYMTNRMEHNLARARYHGLIAFVDKGSGEYLITPKGAAFLRGEPVWKTAIISKVEKKSMGYWEADGKTTYGKLVIKEPYWQGAYQGDLDEATGTFRSSPQSSLGV